MCKWFKSKTYNLKKIQCLEEIMNSKLVHDMEFLNILFVGELKIYFKLL